MPPNTNGLSFGDSGSKSAQIYWSDHMACARKILADAFNGCQELNSGKDNQTAECEIRYGVRQLTREGVTQGSCLEFFRSAQGAGLDWPGKIVLSDDANACSIPSAPHACLFKSDCRRFTHLCGKASVHRPRNYCMRSDSTVRERRSCTVRGRAQQRYSCPLCVQPGFSCEDCLGKWLYWPKRVCIAPQDCKFIDTSKV